MPCPGGSVLRADALVILSRSVRSQIEPTVGREQGGFAEPDSAPQGLKQAQIVQLFRKQYTSYARSAASGQDRTRSLPSPLAT